MRRFLHWLVLACGFALVCLRLYPSDDTEWISNLFFDDVVRAKAEAISLQIIGSLGTTGTSGVSYASNLTSLVHTVVILLEVVIIAVFFYLVARKI
ncbi:MAG TPA: hypothetical protein VLW86_04225 [Syntrophorhabdales bacterium]|nr:hypothetical protein [Syntrophorhabdales bacterium]